MAKRSKEKLWLKCVNLGRNPNNADIEALFKSVEIDDLGLDDLGGYSGISHYELDKEPVISPSITAFKKWHSQFYSIFDYWLKNKDLTGNHVDWINNHVSNFINLRFRKIPIPKHPFDLSTKQERQPIMNFIVTQFAEFLANSESELRQCEAEDCQKYFVPTPRGRKQRFCSKKCYYRIRKRIERAEK